MIIPLSFNVEILVTINFVYLFNKYKQKKYLGVIHKTSNYNLNL